ELFPSRLIGRGVFLHDAAQLLLLISLSTCQENITDIERLVICLLHHPDHQVVNVVLIFIEALVSSGRSLDLEDEDSTLPVDAVFCKQVHEWNRSHGGVLANTISTSTEIGEILVKQVMADKQDKYQECYQRMFLVISECPKLVLGLERSSEQMLQSLLKKCHDEYENISWTIIKCVGAIINIVMPSARTGSELCCSLVTFSSTEKSITCRMTVANILLNNTSWLRGDVSFLSVLDLCKLWTVVMTLLDDDSACVRDVISELATRLDCTSQPVMSQRARELLLDCFTTMMMHRDTLMCCVCLVVWCVGASDTDGNNEDLPEERVFDKGEMNIFAEAATLTDLVSGHLKKLLKQRDTCELFETTLSADVKAWIAHTCWPDYDSTEIVGNYSSLADFVKRAEESAILPCSSSHFLLLSQKSGFLTLYRTRKLIEVIQEAVCSE
ncbi:hypothetical protein L9F63_021648, partial [Diploptera punctata]